ncbi:WYL domain-containing protein [Neptuniibacter halophilus]|uniref:WYL domain-containing protein n=1 Tax=Neptuniibacter halophilus TaxID=651666 RepID=UPI0025745F9E|nr:WYL domain-containing protein [Neptuniibacter halophilus]
MFLDPRIQLIDQYLYFWGAVGRSELIEHFDVSTATSSRILKQYREAYPENMFYKVDKRAYIATDSFKPLVDHSPEVALELLAYGHVQQKINRQTYGPEGVPAFIAKLDAESVAAITRAITNRYEVQIEYASGTSGISKRWVTPHSVFRNGSKWYFRAFCYKNNGFRNFIFGRVINPLSERSLQVKASKEQDIEWLTQVNLTIAPHSKSSYPETLRVDLGLSDEPVRNIQTNSALAGFILNDLRVDCSLGGTLDPMEFNLQLMNRAEVMECPSMQLAPGFN